MPSLNGAGASIGTFAVQIAKAMGAEVAAVDDGIKEKMLLQIGAEHFLTTTNKISPTPVRPMT